MGTEPFRALAFFAFVKDCVCVTEPDGDSPFHLLTMPVSPDSGESIDERGLAVIHMPDNTNICARYYFFWHQ
jgi:hypothetical protein